MTNTPPTRFAIVGAGARAWMFIEAIRDFYRERHHLVGLCDINRTRMAWTEDQARAKFGGDPIPMYGAEDFLTMLRQERVQTVIVTTVDRTHARYIIAAMEAGCDVITEKPLTIDASSCKEILAARKRTGRQIRVTFNYRYAPKNARIKELLREGVIGRVISVHFEWMLDTIHGADYFRRWHRHKSDSGGLMVHKATHHFDLVNWWLETEPDTVFGFGGLRFYGRTNAEDRGVRAFYDRGTGHPQATACPFHLDLRRHDHLRGMYLEAEHEDGYRRDHSVFGDGISIEDDMAVLVRYRNQATMSYHLTAYSPWEGYRVMFNGTGGRLEVTEVEKPYVSGATDPRLERPGAYVADDEDLASQVLVRPLWKKPYEIPVVREKGGHGGGDRRMLDDLFLGNPEDPLGTAADEVAGANSILTGLAANRSFATGLPVRTADFLD